MAMTQVRPAAGWCVALQAYWLALLPKMRQSEAGRVAPARRQESGAAACSRLQGGLWGFAGMLGA